MKNRSIFALFEIGENLYSIQYENDKPYAFKQIFDDWNDIEYLFDFFDEHITDLHSDFWQDKFGRKITVEEAVQITRNQASNFETSVLKNNSENLIDELFRPLSKHPFKHLPKKSLTNMAFKAYGTNYQKKEGFDHPDAFDCDYYSFEI